MTRIETVTELESETINLKIMHKLNGDPVIRQLMVELIGKLMSRMVLMRSGRQ